MATQQFNSTKLLSCHVYFPHLVNTNRLEITHVSLNLNAQQAHGPL